MAFPFFYIEAIQNNTSSIILNEETSKHVVQVLRMQNGEQLQLTDGRGNLFTAAITDNHKRNCEVKTLQITNHQLPTTNSTIAVSLVKNAHRFEWFLEKATEIGVTEIIPLICARTEKQHFRHDRMKGIIISAMLRLQHGTYYNPFHPIVPKMLLLGPGTYQGDNFCNTNLCCFL